MVRGRRVRAVVSSRIGDCLSPKPKRLNGTNGTITAYFQNVNNLHTESINIELTKTRKQQESSLIFNLDYEKFGQDEETDSPKLESFDFNLEKLSTIVDKLPNPATPVMNNKQNNTYNNNGLIIKDSPTSTTPHKILYPSATKENNKTNNSKGAAKQKKNLNHQLTDYFPVRRSERKSKKTVLEEKQRTLELLLRNEIVDGLEVRDFQGKGRGVVTSRPFCKGDYVVEYSGDLIDMAEAKRRELKYSQDQTAGCYMYYFKHNDQQYCVDATAETGKLGRLVNHSRNGNLITRTVSVDNKPRLVLIAKEDISTGEEVTYDYGDRSKESLKHHPWLAY